MTDITAIIETLDRISNEMQTEVLEPLADMDAAEAAELPVMGRVNGQISAEQCQRGLEAKAENIHSEIERLRGWLS